MTARQSAPSQNVAAESNYVAQISEAFVKDAELIAARYRIALPVGKRLADFASAMAGVSHRASADEIEKLRIAALMTAEDGMDYLKADYITSSLRALRDQASRPPLPAGGARPLSAARRMRRAA